LIKLFDKYLKILKLKRKDPSIEYLTELVTSHITKIPFENISKLYYFKTKNLNKLINFDQYLFGIDKHNFGGTCYSNNYYFNQLLNNLGFEALLCGADMNILDAHLISIVVLNNKQYLIDVGYGAPFFNPIPLDLKEEYTINFGNETYLIGPKDSKGHSELKYFIKNKFNHGYIIKPVNRSITEFEGVINKSFQKSSPFLNRITAINFSVNSSIAIRNYSMFITNSKNVKKIDLLSKNHIIENIVQNFNIDYDIVKGVIDSTNF
jgi:arylamine N-acetyltransferase